MIKGFIFFKEGKIPFVANEYRMELFTDDDLLTEFSREYNFKKNYTLHGQYFRNGIQGQPATFLVEYSMGSTCYLRCYIINMLASESTCDTIGLQSPFLDDVFRYKHSSEVNSINMLYDLLSIKEKQAMLQLTISLLSLCNATEFTTEFSEDAYEENQE